MRVYVPSTRFLPGFFVEVTDHNGANSVEFRGSGVHTETGHPYRVFSSPDHSPLAKRNLRVMPVLPAGEFEPVHLGQLV